MHSVVFIGHRCNNVYAISNDLRKKKITILNRKAKMDTYKQKLD